MTPKLKITAQSPPEQLPDNIATLKQMVLTLLAQIDDVVGQLYYLKRQLFGKKSEKLDPNQRLLFEDMYNDLQAQVDAKEEEEDKTEIKKKKKKKNATHQGRKPLPKDLPRETIVIEPDAEELVCPDCHCAKEQIGSEVSERLELAPYSIYVEQTVRPKYACKCCQGNVSIAPLEPRAIDKGIAGEGLLAHVITSKYCDHLPLKRLEGMLKRHGVEIAVSTLCDWVAKCADLLEPIVKRMHERILQSPKINTDDTAIPVKSPKRKGSTYNGYLWTYIGDQMDVVFDFTATRSRQGPIKFLGDYDGYVQADAYSGYDEFFRMGNATEVGCNAHARRKFEYALDSDPVRAAHLMVLWKKLYEIESRAKKQEFTPAQLLEVRQNEARPIFDEIKIALMDYKDQVLPKNPLGKAITYALNQWDALMRYTDSPILDIDNNISERTLRMVVIGRKNYMFAGSEAGAWRASIIYSLVASCKLKGIDPFAYFRDVLKRISTHPASQIDELLPANWKTPTPTSTASDKTTQVA